MIKLDVNSGVVHHGHVDLPRSNRSSCHLAGTVSGQTAFDKLVRPAAMCRGEKHKTGNWKKLKEQT